MGCVCQEEEGIRYVFVFQAEDGVRDYDVTGVQTCALPIFLARGSVVNSRSQRVEVLVEERFEGTSLKEVMGGLRWGAGNLDLARTTVIIGEVCEALEHMTGHDLYHRDVKPSNIILHPERGAVLIDFGLAKEVVAGEDVSLSKGASEGWSPPERARGVSGPFTDRSEERRVGKECRSRWSPSH